MNTLWRIAREAARYRGWLALAVFGTLALTAVNLVVPRIMAAMTGMVADGMTPDGFSTVLWMAGALLGLFMLRVLFRFMGSYCSHRAAWRLVLELRMKTYDAIQSFSMDYFGSRQTGELVSRVMNDVRTFELIYAHIVPEIIANSVTLIGVTLILFSINPHLALITCIPIPLILLSGWFFARKVRPLHRIDRKAEGELSAQLQDNFAGMKEIQAFGRQRSASRKVLDRGEHFTATVLRALKMSAVFHPGVEFLTAIGSVIVVGFGGFLAMRGGLSVADVVAFLLYLALFYAPIAGVAHLMESVQQSLAGAERVIEVLDAPRSISDAPDALPMEGARGRVTFEEVGFRYAQGPQVLDRVSFDVKPGQMAALVGATGVGKTTVSQLVSRFYDPTEGRVLLDGRDLRGITLDSLRGNVSVVLQDTFLFNGTIEENIAFARPDATFGEVESAARTARIHEDIMRMPDGYGTQVGERGIRLSGGQKQRVAIARAILCRAPVLILDEATASVDAETEAQIQQAIGEIAGTRTIITIAHRLSTVRGADVILVFEEGRIAQFGTHAELIAREGPYRRLCAANGEPDPVS